MTYGFVCRRSFSQENLPGRRLPDTFLREHVAAWLPRAFGRGRGWLRPGQWPARIITCDRPGREGRSNQAIVRLKATPSATASWPPHRGFQKHGTGTVVRFKLALVVLILLRDSKIRFGVHGLISHKTLDLICSARAYWS